MEPISKESIRGLLRTQGPLLGLIAIIFGIFVAQEIGGIGWYRHFMAVPAHFMESWEKVKAGDFSINNLHHFGTLLTCAFLHNSPEHVVYNMLFLWIFAALSAELLGHRWMLLIFMVTAISGSILHGIINARDFTPVLGASGAVMGFEGAYLGIALRWRLPDPNIWPMSRPVPPSDLALIGVVGVVIDYTSLMSHAYSKIAYGAHIGGFIGGLVLTTVFAPPPRDAKVA
jgi:membrane associated rhomboid family serine protease